MVVHKARGTMHVITLLANIKCKQNVVQCSTVSSFKKEND